MKIYEFKVDISWVNEISWALKEFTLIGENEHHLVIDNYWFTVLRKGKEGSSLNKRIEQPGIIDWTRFKFTEKFTITLYTKEASFKKAETKIRRHFEKFLQEKSSPYLMVDNPEIRLTIENKR